jgi:hypothetical protein
MAYGRWFAMDCNKRCGCKCSGGLNSIAELEIHYSESEAAEAPVYIFERLYCITSLQNMELVETGFEGHSYESLDDIRTQVVKHLTDTGVKACELLNSADISYIRDDV